MIYFGIKKFSFCKFSLKLVDLVLVVSSKLYFPMYISCGLTKMNYMQFHIESVVNLHEFLKAGQSMNLLSCGLQIQHSCRPEEI